jgi:hypothetical protein
MTSMLEIKPATKNDAGIILELIKDIAEYEKLSDQVEATKESIIKYLFDEKAFAECLIGFA